MQLEDPNAEKCEYKIKYMLLGDYGVGKTSLVNCLLQRQCGADGVIVDHVEKILAHKESGVLCLLDIIDPSCSDKNVAFVHKYVRRRTCYVLVFDVTNRVSFERLNYWLNMIKENGASPLSYIVVVGNKCDLDDQRSVYNKEVVQWTRQYCGLFSCYSEVSCKENYNVNKVFENSMSSIYENIVAGGYVRPYDVGITMIQRPLPQCVTDCISPVKRKDKRCLQSCIVL